MLGWVGSFAAVERIVQQGTREAKAFVLRMRIIPTSSGPTNTDLPDGFKMVRMAPRLPERHSVYHTTFGKLHNIGSSEKIA